MLDRVATIRVYAAGSRNDSGRYAQGATTEHRIWVGRLDPTDSERLLEPEGVRVEGDGNYIARWTSTLASLDLALDPEIVVDGRTYRITRVSEMTMRRRHADRRRWIRITSEGGLQ